MNDEALNLLREIIVSVQSPSETVDECYALRITCKSGAMFEIEAAITDLEHKLEILEVGVRSTTKFAKILQWPGGPEIEWFEMNEISNALRNSPIESISLNNTDQGFLDALPVPGRSEIQYKLVSGESLVISHLNTPGVIEVRVDQ